MKKFVSMAMVAAMTTSMVPATAFAASDVDATAKVVNSWTETDEFGGVVSGNKVPELQIKITDENTQKTGADFATKFTVTLDNADFDNTAAMVGTNPSAIAIIPTTDTVYDTTTEYSYEAVSAEDLKVMLSEIFAQRDTVVANGTLTGNVDAGVMLYTVNNVNAGPYNASVPGQDLSDWALAALLADNDGGNEAAGYLLTALATATDADEAAWVTKAWNALTTAAGGTTAATATDWAYREVATNKTLATTNNPRNFTITSRLVDTNELEVVVDGAFLKEGDVIYIDLLSTLDNENKDAFVAVTSDDITFSNDDEDLLYVDIASEGITASVKKLATVAEEEKAFLERDLKLEATVGNFALNQVIELKLSNGFEFASVNTGVHGDYELTKVDDDVVEVKVKNGNTDTITIDKGDLEIEAVSAKAGSVATMKVKATAKPGFNASTSVEVAKVVDYTVMMSVDEDEDVPVIYSGVNVNNDGLTDDSDHMSLEVTIEESFPGAWSMRKGFNLELPDGVYVTDVEVTDAADLYVGTNSQAVDKTEVRDAFWNAYQEGDHKGFEFEKRVFNDVDTSLNAGEATMSFKLELVADPGFVGDVNLKLTGDLIDEQEVTVATFATPFIVTAEQNDLKIDYRYTEVPTDIVITETEAGLWDAGAAQFGLYIEKDLLTFEDDPKFEVTGGLEITDEGIEENFALEYGVDRLGNVVVTEEADVLFFEVDTESDEAATVTISDMQLFMQRNIPAGPYDLKLATSMGAGYISEVLFAADADETDVRVEAANGRFNAPAKEDIACDDADKDYIIDDVCDFSDVVKEAFINVVTAGREQDDASFTTKVVVPVGESYIVSGENQVELDVPAYISEAGYTMLPVRAVANALGINNNNVLWNGETKTVTILYGQRIITMVAGQKVINVNGSAIPASAAVEIKDGRTFLPLRDLGTALGVTTIDWDAATKTATLN